MSDNETTKTIRVRMTLRPPVLLQHDEWPIIAAATAHAGDFRTWYLRVRKNVDDSKGCIVYGRFETSWQRERPAHAGYLCARDAVPATLQQVGREICAPDWLVREAIADLPEERI